MGLPPEKTESFATMDDFSETHRRKWLVTMNVLIGIWELPLSNKKQHDVRARNATVTVGDWLVNIICKLLVPQKVLVEVTQPRWQKCYTGRYFVTRQIGPVNYLLLKSDRSKPNVVHVNKFNSVVGQR